MNELFKYLDSPNFIIDIGANIGEFSNQICNRYPLCEAFLIEANPNCEIYLKSLPYSYLITGLSDRNGYADFFVEKTNPIATGASFYKENTNYYDNGKFYTNNIKISTLDSLNIFEDNIIDLVKIDTQGSELDIINGGIQTLQRSRYLLLESSFLNYNLNAPLIDVVHKRVKEIDFIIEDIIDYHKFDNGNIFQIDILYKNKKYK